MFKALVLAGDGINCEQETADALSDVGFRPYIVHVNDILKSYQLFSEIKLFVVPGGFSFGDELGSGKILALKLKHGLGNVLNSFIESGGAVLGICNGFQVLTQLGLFGKSVVLAENKQGRFIDQWVELEIIGKSIFTDQLVKNGKTKLELPMRHGEGRLLVLDEDEKQGLINSGSCVLRYTSDVNGAWNQVAGLSSFEGRVFGLMPHPEAFWVDSLHPDLNQKGLPFGLELFNNAYQYFSSAYKEL